MTTEKQLLAFALIVAEMRTAQQTFERTRQSWWKEKARKLEKEVDEFIDRNRLAGKSTEQNKFF